MPPTGSRELSVFLDGLIAGDSVKASSMSVLSDLARDDVEQLRSTWTQIPDENRLAVIVRAIELAEDNVDLNFAALALVALADPLADVRARAAEALWESPGHAVADALTLAVRADPDEDVRAAAAASLRQFVILREFDQIPAREGDAVVDALRAAVEEESSPAARAAALESLGARGLPWVTNLISEAYISDDRRVRIAAVHAMGESADERWLDYLHEQFYSDDSEFRFEAATAAGNVGSEDSIEPLVALLDDDDSNVILAAVAALGEIAGREAIAALKEFAGRAPEGMDEAVAEALEVAKDTSGPLTDEDDDDDDGEMDDE
jgi:HEAT repeat protein